MSKTAMIRARTEPELKEDVEHIFHMLGLSCSEAINLFYQQVKLNRGLPFEVKIPNAVTVKAIEDAEKGIGVHECETVDELFEDLGI